jgi:WD40 repeat protein/serine/threonine protein kinase
VTEDRADRELLFEALAVHLGFVGQQALGELKKARQSHASQHEPRSLGELLVEESLLEAGQCAVLETVVDGLLERHRGDVGRCLDALCGFSRLRRELTRREVRPGATPGTGTLSTNPTLPSVAIKGAQDAADSDDARGNWCISSELDRPSDEEEVEAEAGVDWFLGTPTSAGMRFRILRPHAQGGIGKVSVAYDAELQREVALKQIKPERADDTDSRARFLLEAEVTGRLEHPGIVPVYGLGIDDQGRPFYAMRFVRGTSFEEAIAEFHRADLDSQRGAPERTLALRHLLARFVDVCQTVAYAHSRGVLHRDLKPANVLLGPFNESLVVDWGLAKQYTRDPADPPSPGAVAEAGQREPGPSDTLLHPGRSKAPGAPDRPPGQDGTHRALASGSGAALGPISSAETAAGMAFGTPAYMSPEQADGRLDQLGPASDVYSLGAMLYTLLSGHAPFEYVWCDVTALLEKVRLGDFPAPRQANPWVPRALEAICLKAMATRAEDRYASGSELAKEIERWLADEPVSAYREPMPARAARWGRRHKPVVAGAAALLLSAVGALSVGIVLIGQEQRKTEAQRLVAEHESILANAKSHEASQKAESLRRRDAVNRVNLAYREYLDDNVALADQLLDGCPKDLRAWEWSYARRLGHAELRTWNASSQGRDVWCVAFSPDGRRLAAGSGPWFQVGELDSGELEVRELRTGALVLAVRGLKGAVQAVAFAPDGRTVALAHGFSGNQAGGNLAVFEVDSGRKVWQVSERGVQILSLAYSSDGRTIATGCGHFNDYSSIGFARLRDAASGSALGQSITGGPGGVLSVAFAPDGKQIALASRDVVDLCDVTDPGRRIAHQLRGHVNFVYAVACSPDGSRVATGGWDKTIRIWDRATGQLVDTLNGHRGFVRGLAFSPDGTQLVSACEDKSVRRWDLTESGGNGDAAFHGHTGFVHCVAFSPDGVLAASGGLDGTVKLWPAAAPDSQVTFRNSAGWVGALAFAPDGRRVASAHDGNIRIWDPRTGEELKRVIGPRGLLGDIGLAFSPNGTMVAASGRGNSVNIWDTASWTPRQSLAGHDQPVRDVAFAPDGSVLATASEDGTLRLWRVDDGTVERTLVAGQKRPLSAVAFSPDGRRVATGGGERIVWVWDVATGAEVAALRGHATGVQDLAFSPDGRSIASVGGAYHGPVPAELKIWDWQARRESAPFVGHTSLVTAVAYLPDGRRLATASDDRTIKLWDVETREDVLTLRGHTSGVVSLAVSADGRQIASGSIDYTAKIWSADSPTDSDAFELSLRRAAVERVQSLFAKHLLKAEVLGALEADRIMSPRLRTVALEVAARRSENASALYEAAWVSLIRPLGRPDDNLLAVRRLEAACQVVAGDPERLAEYQRALALAYYRAGLPAKALQMLQDSAGGTPDLQPSPLSLAVSAMANQKLGHKEEARARCERLRSLLKADRFANDQEAIGFLREAERVVDSAAQ